MFGMPTPGQLQLEELATTADSVMTGLKVETHGGMRTHCSKLYNNLTSQSKQCTYLVMNTPIWPAPRGLLA